MREKRPPDTVFGVAVLVGPHGTYRTLPMRAYFHGNVINTVPMDDQVFGFSDPLCVPELARPDNAAWRRIEAIRNSREAHLGKAEVHGVLYYFYQLEGMERPVTGGELDFVVSDIEATRKVWSVKETTALLDLRIDSMERHNELMAKTGSR